MYFNRYVIRFFLNSVLVDMLLLIYCFTLAVKSEIDNMAVYYFFNMLK